MRRLALTVPATVLALVAAVAAAGAAPAAAGGSAPGTPPLTAPLASASLTAGASWAVVAMGDLHQPLNTFWQLFARTAAPGGGGRWRLVTPPGVADNGGLVASVPPAGPVSVAVEPSQYLRFTPLARTADAGSRWDPGLLPAPAAKAPDALAPAGATASGLLAIVGDAGGAVVTGGLTSARWRSVVRLRTLAAGAARACRPVAFTAVSWWGGGPLVGTRCTRRGAAVYAEASGRWRPVGGPGRAGPTEVLRMVRSDADHVTVLSSDGDGRLVAAWYLAPQAPAGRSTPVPAAVTATAPWALPRGQRLRSTAVGPGEVVVLSGGGGRRTLAEAAGTSATWVRLPPPPPSATTVAPVPGGALDAFAVSRSRLTVYALAPGATAWVPTQHVEVPIEYGSSS